MGEANLRILSFSSIPEGKAAFNSELCCFSGKVLVIHDLWSRTYRISWDPWSASSPHHHRPGNVDQERLEGLEVCHHKVAGGTEHQNLRGPSHQPRLTHLSSGCGWIDGLSGQLRLGMQKKRAGQFKDPGSEFLKSLNQAFLCFSCLAFSATATFMQHLILYFWNRFEGPASLTSLSDLPSQIGSTKSNSFNSNMVSDLTNVENLFITGVLDELRICFSSSYQSNQSFKKTLLAKENSLLEFRAVGGQIELSIRANNIFIGTLLRSLEIEDQFCFMGMPMPRYLARSIIKNAETGIMDSLSIIRQLRNNGITFEEIFDAVVRHYEVSDSGSRSPFSLDAKDFEYLEAAILLHNIGELFGKKGYHKRSYDIIKNSDQLHGFSSKEIELVALLARFHRKKFPKHKHDSLQNLSGETKRKFKVLCVIIRVSHALQQCQQTTLHGLEVRYTDEGFKVVFTGLEDESLADLDAEVQAELKYFEKVLKQKILVSFFLNS